MYPGTQRSHYGLAITFSALGAHFCAGEPFEERVSALRNSANLDVSVAPACKLLLPFHSSVGDHGPVPTRACKIQARC